MKKSRFIQHYKDRQAAFLFYFNKTVEKLGMEDIHKLRVTIKKLRAIWSLMEITSHGRFNKKEHLALFSNLFNTAGDVRDAQVSLGLIRQNKALYLVPFSEYLTKVQDCGNEELIRSLNSFDQGKLMILNNNLLQIMQELSDEMLLRQSAGYVLAQIREVGELQEFLPDNRKLHKIRIQLKAVHEILTIMHELIAETGFYKSRKNIKSLNLWIGRWHDYTMLLSFLRDFAEKTEKGTRQPRYFLYFIKKIEHHQELWQVSIHGKLIQYLTAQQLKPIENLT